MSSGYALDDSEEEDYFDDFEDDSVDEPQKGKAAITDVEDKPETKINTKKQDVSKTNSTIKQKQANQSSNISNSTNVKAKTNSSKKEVSAKKHNKKAVRTNSNMVPGSKTSQEATIEKLRLANSALRNQLKEFARALDASIKNSHSKQVFEPTNKSLEMKEKMLKNMKQKIEIYKKTNKELSRQLKEARSQDRVLLLENQVKEKSSAIQLLKKDNKMLLAIQRKQTKEINAKEELKQAWPHRITSLENDIRVYKEKLRKVRSRDMKFAETRKKQDREIEVLKQTVLKLKRQLEDAVMPESRKREEEALRLRKDSAEKWKEEKEKMKRKIFLLEKLDRTNQQQFKRDLRLKEKALREATEENDRLREELSLKEKQVRLQVLQVKRVKKQLKTLVLQEEPIALPRQRPVFQPSRPSGDGKRNNRGIEPSPLVSNRINDTTEMAASEFKAQAKGTVLTEEDKDDDPLQNKASEDESINDYNRLSLDANDPATVGAATKLQAGYRGYSQRRKMVEIKESHNAATKLQSRYRGYTDRKKVKHRLESKKRANALAEQQKYEMEQNNIELESKSSTIKESKLVVAEEDDASKSTEIRAVETSHEHTASESTSTFSKPIGRRKKKEKKKYY